MTRKSCGLNRISRPPKNFYMQKNYLKFLEVRKYDICASTVNWVPWNPGHVLYF
jgi:hypothetical protein